MRKGITFSTDGDKITRKDINASSKLAEDFFQMETDPNQFRATPENRDWTFKNNEHCLNMIKNDGKVIGFSFALPCTT
ncbi:MAG: hypothetical protein WCK90_04150, partial [archaeon]